MEGAAAAGGLGKGAEQALSSGAVGGGGKNSTPNPTAPTSTGPGADTSLGAMGGFDPNSIASSVGGGGTSSPAGDPISNAMAQADPGNLQGAQRAVGGGGQLTQGGQTPTDDPSNQLTQFAQNNQTLSDADPVNRELKTNRAQLDASRVNQGDAFSGGPSTMQPPGPSGTPGDGQPGLSSSDFNQRYGDLTGGPVVNDPTAPTPPREGQTGQWGVTATPQPPTPMPQARPPGAPGYPSPAGGYGTGSGQMPMPPPINNAPMPQPRPPEAPQPPAAASGGDGTGGGGDIGGGTKGGGTVAGGTPGTTTPPAQTPGTQTGGAGGRMPQSPLEQIFSQFLHALMGGGGRGGPIGALEQAIMHALGINPNALFSQFYGGGFNPPAPAPGSGYFPPGTTGGRNVAPGSPLVPTRPRSPPPSPPGGPPQTPGTAPSALPPGRKLSDRSLPGGPYTAKDPTQPPPWYPGDRPGPISAKGGGTKTPPPKGRSDDIPRPPRDIPFPPHSYSRGRGEPGEFNWARTGALGRPGQNLTTVTFNNGQSARLNAAVADRYKGFVNELISRGYPVNLSGGGGYVNRQNVNNPRALSMHAYGAALDINPGSNPNKGRTTDMPPDIEQMAWKWGLSWGGRFGDPMHFEPMSPQAWASKRAQMANRYMGAD